MSDETKKPRPQHTRPGGKKMSDEDIQSLVQVVLEDAKKYNDEELSPDRAEASDYYAGEPMGNEEEGRSQFVATEVRDAVKATIPGLLRIFFGPERVVEFLPTGPGKEEQAKQETDYVHHVFRVENGGVLVSRSAIKDALVKGIGAFKWGWDETAKATAHVFENVTEEQLEALASDEAIKLTRVETDDATKLSKVYYTKLSDGCAWVKAVPPEEIIFTREARSKDDAIAIAHVTDLTRGELVAMGIDDKVIEEHGGQSDLRDGQEEVARRSNVSPDDSGSAGADAGEENELIQYAEAYMQVDVDGDGKRELRKFCTIGPSWHVVNGEGELVDHIPLAIGTPDPEPHAIKGRSFHNDLKDVQRLKSALLRGIFDSLALSIYPRTAYVENQAAVEDILNTEVGAPMRMRAPGMIQSFAHNFTGGDALPLLSVVDGMTESRTGKDKGSMGLDADALQSSTKEAVGAAVTSSQERQAELALLFAEQLFKPMFLGLRRLFRQYQPRKRTIQLRGKWVDIDPRSWDDTDVVVNVAIGSSREERLATLEAIIMQQKEFLSLLGPQNPIVSLNQLSKAIARRVELAGFYDTGEFFNIVPEDWAPPQPEAPQPTPEQVIAEAEMQIEQMKATKDIAIKERELELREEEMIRQDDRERTKLAAEIELKRLEMELKFQNEIRLAEINADIERTKLAHEVERDRTKLALEVEKTVASESRAHEAHGRDQSRKDEKHQHDMVMNERKADAVDKKAEQAATPPGTE